MLKLPWLASKTRIEHNADKKGAAKVLWCVTVGMAMPVVVFVVVFSVRSGVVHERSKPV